MRTTKKLTITLFMTFSISMSVFSQAPSFSEHLEKAKQYEVEKLWIHALGEYYDAMELVPIDNAKDVFQCWENLAETIESGNPGYGKFNDFDFVDNWIFLLQEYEKYWTHTAPKTFYFEKPERIELNRENRTATYKFGIRLIETGKFKEIDAIVQKGFKKAYKEDWNIDFLKNWPQESVYNDKKYGDKYLIEDTALASVKLARLNNSNYSSFDEENKYSPVKKDSGTHLFGSRVGYPVANEFQHSKKTPAFSCSVSTWTSTETDFWVKRGSVSLYDIKFHVADKAGNVLLQSTRYNIPYKMEEDLRYEFKDVPQNTMQLIEDDKVDIIIDGVYLEYGKFYTYAISGSRSYLKNLPELKIDNYTLNSWLTQKKESIENYLQDRNKVIHEGLEKKSYFQSNYNYVLKTMPSMNFGRSYWENLSKKYGSKDATTVYYYLFCNKLSELENLEPVYKLQNQNEADETYESEDVLFLENFENLICDTSASGWRLPTESEDSVLKNALQNDRWYDLNTDEERYIGIRDRYIIRTGGDKEKAQFNKKKEQELASFEEFVFSAARGLAMSDGFHAPGIYDEINNKSFEIGRILCNDIHRIFNSGHMLNSKLQDIFLYLVCNEKSKLDNLSPCYSLKNGNDKISIKTLFDDCDEIICDSNQSGWRVATQEEEYEHSVPDTILVVRRIE